MAVVVLAVAVVDGLLDFGGLLGLLPAPALLALGVAITVATGALDPQDRI